MGTLLFNFSVSYSGGGFKRLYEYCKWFNSNGGADFIIHPQSESLLKEFPLNRYFIVHQRPSQRILKDCFYLKDILKQTGTPFFYYSYGIPVYSRVGIINWFHVSNVLPFTLKDIPVSFFDYIKFTMLRFKIKNNLPNADHISAESLFSLSHVSRKYDEKKVLSVNGSDDEIDFYNRKEAHHTSPVNEAIVVGTYKYKAIPDSYHIFRHLKKTNPELKFVVIGNREAVTENIRQDADVILKGIVKRELVIDALKTAKYYISTTCIENSYNAASEGVFLANESYISDIAPHRELLKGCDFTLERMDGVKLPLINVKRENVSVKNLKTWNDVIREMLEKIGYRITLNNPRT